MALPEAISRRPSSAGLDFESVRAEAVRFIQQLSGEIWTDYNEHDPGVTILEQFCYALTELSYRAGFPVKDLLAAKDGRIDTRRQALHTPRRILPSEPVTTKDFRKLLVDRMPVLGNAWFEPRPRSGPDAVDGLYDVLLYAPAAEPCVCECAPPDPLIQQALRIYARHRALCEDVHRITVLRPTRTLIYATVVVEGNDAPEAIMAELLYRAGNFLAPELRRRPLSELMAAGKPPSEIFEGPLLCNGFIDDAELGCRTQQIACAELVKAMASLPGVLSVNDVTVRLGRRTYGTSDTITVPPGEIPQLDPGLQLKFLPIRLVRQGSACKPDRERIRQGLTRRWRAHRRTYPLRPDYASAFPLPHGRHRDLAQYASVQTQFPVVYGIGPHGLPADASALRRAQAKQLKGYLLVFEQLLADYLAQLAHARDLLSAEPDIDRSYFARSLGDAVTGADELVIDGAELDSLRRQHDPWLDRRNRFLDLLLALYAEELPRTMPGNCGGLSAEDDERLIQAKLGLLRQLVTITRSRGRGFDYLAPQSARNAAGMELKSRLQLGMELDPGASENSRQLHLIEHVLLRAGRRLRGASNPPDGFDYGLTVSAILCVTDGEAGDLGFRRQTAALLRANAPAHVNVVARFLGPAQAHTFQALHTAWRDALRAREPRAIVERSIAMRGFLLQCGSGEDNVAQANGGGGGPSSHSRT